MRKSLNFFQEITHLTFSIEEIFAMILIALALAMMSAVVTFIIAVGSRRTIYTSQRQTNINRLLKWIYRHLRDLYHRVGFLAWRIWLRLIIGMCVPGGILSQNRLFSCIIIELENPIVLNILSPILFTCRYLYQSIELFSVDHISQNTSSVLLIFSFLITRKSRISLGF